MKRLIPASLRSLLRQSRFFQFIRMRQLRKLSSQGLPSEFARVALFLIDPSTDKNGREVSTLVEKRRSEIAAMDSNDGGLPILYSPKPGSDSSAGSDLEHIRPEHGVTTTFSYAKIASTGKNWRWGTALYILAREFNATNAIELGACAGLSAMYLASAPTMKRLITVEGSAPLADLASESVASYPHVTVCNQLFDDALDTYLPLMSGHIDFAYIDGHHEKVATMHYFQRMLPHLARGAIVVFDDIRWSSDMYDCWKLLINTPTFATVIDFGAIGIGRLPTHEGDHQREPTQWDLSGIMGYRKIGNPRGWE